MSLREFHPEDHPAWQRIAGDPRVAAHTPWPALVAPEAAAAWINESLRMAAVAPRRSFHLVIEQYGTDLVGCGTLDVLSIPHRQGEIGLYLRPDRWGEGLGTEVARLLLELAFTRLGLHRVQATADPDNIAAKRVLEHVNMRHEGTLLDRYLVDGQWRDRDMFAITLPEWRGLPLRRVATASAGIADAQLVGGSGSLLEPGAERGAEAGAEAAEAGSAQGAPAAAEPEPASVPVVPQEAETATVMPERVSLPRPRTRLPEPPAARAQEPVHAPVQTPVPAAAPVPADVEEPLEGIVSLAHELDDLEADQEIFGSL